MFPYLLLNSIKKERKKKKRVQTFLQTLEEKKKA